jgi:hypothetical protein
MLAKVAGRKDPNRRKEPGERQGTRALAGLGPDASRAVPRRRAGRGRTLSCCTCLRRPAERAVISQRTKVALAAGTGSRPARCNAAEQLQAMKDLLAEVLDKLAEVEASQDELRQDRDEWRGRAERLLTDQRRPWWRRGCQQPRQGRRGVIATGGVEAPLILR